MLSIQPKVTDYSGKRQLYFRGEALTPTLDAADWNTKYEYKTNFYESQIKEFDKSINDKQTPDMMKKILKGFKVVSEALLEGWAVTWGATKGARVIKSAVVTSNGKIGKEAQEILTPFGKGLKNFGQELTEYVQNIKTSEFWISCTEYMTKLTEKMNNDSVGKYLVKCMNSIGKGFKFLFKPFKGADASEIYDKASKATATTLGVGAGAAGAYNAIMLQDNKENAVSEKTGYDIYNDEKDEVQYG